MTILSRGAVGQARRPDYAVLNLEMLFLCSKILLKLDPDWKCIISITVADPQAQNVV